MKCKRLTAMLLVPFLLCACFGVFRWSAFAEDCAEPEEETAVCSEPCEPQDEDGSTPDLEFQGETIGCRTERKKGVSHKQILPFQ